jgi:hypothetical protein
MMVASAGIRPGFGKRFGDRGGDLSRIVDWKDRNTCVLFGDVLEPLFPEPERERSGFGR